MDNAGLIAIRSVNSAEGATLFRNNYYVENKGQISFELGKPILAGNIIRNNTFVAFQGYSNNSIVNFDYCDPIIVNNTITDNVISGGTALTTWSGVSKIANNIFYNNDRANISLYVDLEYLNSGGRVFQNNLSNDDIIPGYGNVVNNPRFA